MQDAPKAFDVVVHLDELIVQGRVGDRCQMKNRVEFFIAELLAPIERRQILRDKITAITSEIFEIAGAKVVDDGETRVRKFFLQGEHKIGADKAGATGDEQIKIGIGSRHGVRLVCALD